MEDNKKLLAAMRPLPHSNAYSIVTDPFGSYTGVVRALDEDPVQDVDDL